MASKVFVYMLKEKDRIISELRDKICLLILQGELLENK